MSESNDSSMFSIESWGIGRNESRPLKIKTWEDFPRGLYGERAHISNPQSFKKDVVDLNYRECMAHGPRPIPCKANNWNRTLNAREKRNTEDIHAEY